MREGILINAGSDSVDLECSQSLCISRSSWVRPLTMGHRLQMERRASVWPEPLRALKREQTIWPAA
jgi:hypothetical protein